MLFEAPLVQHTGNAETIPPTTAEVCPEIQLVNQPVIANNISYSLLQDFYDPAGKLRHLSQEQFIDSVAGTREHSQVHQLGLVSGYEVILCEATHCLLTATGDEEIGIPLPVTAERQQAIIQNTEQLAQCAVQAFRDTSDAIAAKFYAEDESYRQWKVPPPSEQMLAVLSMVATAHHEQERRSGKPFFTHPYGVAAMGRVVFQLYRQYHPKSYNPRDPFFENSQILDLAHDTPEDSIDAAGKHIGNLVPVTPFVIFKLLDSYGNNQAYNVAKTSYYLMRTKDIYGNRKPYQKSIRTGLAQIPEIADHQAFTKAKDNLYNRDIEPDMPSFDRRREAKTRKNRVNYDDSIDLIADYAADRTPNEYGTNLRKLIQIARTVKLKEINDEIQKSFAFQAVEAAVQTKQRMANLLLQAHTAHTS